MILADTSVWIDHFRNAIPHFSSLLSEEMIVLHPMVYGEIALGNIPGRTKVLGMLRDLLHLEPAEHEEVVALIDAQKLYGIGIGFIDAHLLAAVRLIPGTAIWTRDKRLAAAADRLGCAFPNQNYKH